MSAEYTNVGGPGGSVEGKAEDGTIQIRVNTDLGWLAVNMLPDDVDKFCWELLALVEKVRREGRGG